MPGPQPRRGPARELLGGQLVSAGALCHQAQQGRLVGRALRPLEHGRGIIVSLIPDILTPLQPTAQMAAELGIRQRVGHHHIIELKRRHGHRLRAQRDDIEPINGVLAVGPRLFLGHRGLDLRRIAQPEDAEVAG